jgi:hypothetical protein
MSDETVAEGPLESASQAHRRLVGRLQATDRDDAAAVYNLAVAVLIHAELERCTLFGRARYVSLELQQTLEREHAALVDDLALMEELAAGDGGTGDLETLCGAVYDRVLKHVERDDRVIYGSLARLDAFSGADPA